MSSALRHVGFGVVDENGEPSNVTPLTDERRQGRPRTGRKAQQAAEGREGVGGREKAKREAAEREQEEREAAEKAEAKQAFEDAVTAAQEAEATVENLDNQLDDAREALAEAQELVKRLGAELDEARERPGTPRSRAARPGSDTTASRGCRGGVERSLRWRGRSPRRRRRPDALVRGLWGRLPA